MGWLALLIMDLNKILDPNPKISKLKQCNRLITDYDPKINKQRIRLITDHRSNSFLHNSNTKPFPIFITMYFALESWSHNYFVRTLALDTLNVSVAMFPGDAEWHGNPISGLGHSSNYGVVLKVDSLASFAHATEEPFIKSLLNLIVRDFE